MSHNGMASLNMYIMCVIPDTLHFNNVRNRTSNNQYTLWWYIKPINLQRII